MPPGLTFTSASSVGPIQGTTTTPGSYSFTIQVTDSFPPPFKISQTFTLNILNNLVLPNGTLPDAVQSIGYTEYINPAGGTPPYHFVLGPYSSTPPGLFLDTATGKVYGTPTTPTQNPDTMLVTISDSAPQPATINPFVTLNVAPPLSFQTTTLPDSARGLNYGGRVNIVRGGEPPPVLIRHGALPPELPFSPAPHRTP